MSVKNNFQAIKEEISNDEKMLEGVFRIESFIRKYKFIFVVLGICFLIWLGYIWSKDYFKEQNAIASTQLMEEIQKDFSNTQAWNDLQEKNYALYEILSFSQAIKQSDSKKLEELSKSKNLFIAHYASYEVSTLNKNFALNNYGSFNSLALLQEGFLASQEKNRSLALKKFSEIQSDSDLKDFANRIGHYGL